MEAFGYLDCRMAPGRDDSRSGIVRPNVCRCIRRTVHPDLIGVVTLMYRVIARYDWSTIHADASMPDTIGSAHPPRAHASISLNHSRGRGGLCKAHADDTNATVVPGHTICDIDTCSAGSIFCYRPHGRHGISIHCGQCVPYTRLGTIVHAESYDKEYCIIVLSDEHADTASYCGELCSMQSHCVGRSLSAMLSTLRKIRTAMHTADALIQLGCTLGEFTMLQPGLTGDGNTYQEVVEFLAKDLGMQHIATQAYCSGNCLNLTLEEAVIDVHMAHTIGKSRRCLVLCRNTCSQPYMPDSCHLL